jgi:hypothetical protein
VQDLKRAETAENARAYPRDKKRNRKKRSEEIYEKIRV